MLIKKEISSGIAFKMQIIFQHGQLFPEKNEYFLRVDTINHFIKVKFMDEEMESQFANWPGLQPNWKFEVNL